MFATKYLSLMYKQFDIVQLKTIKNVKYVSSPQNNPTKPQGKWSVVGIVDGELLLAKDFTIIRIPAIDVIKIANYEIPIIRQENDDGEEKER